jgi:outer membrane protein assembly factor BamA
MKRVVTLVLLAAAAIFPQTQPAQKKTSSKTAVKTAPPVQDKWPIGVLKVEGNVNYTAAQVLGIAGIKAGDLVGRRDFETARERLMATGAFESVGYGFEPDENKKAYVATFRVAEVTPVFPIHFENLGAADADLLKMLGERDPLFSATKVPASKLVMDRYASWLQEFLAAKAAEPGKAPKVAGEVAQLAPGDLAVIFRPAGPRPVVARVFFEGNQVVPQNLLQEAIWPVGVGTPWSEANFRVLLDSSVRPLYEARGRIRVSFPKLREEPVPDVQGLKVTVTVDEGEVYSLGQVEIAGDSPIEPAALLRAGDFKKGDIANFDRVNEGVEQIRAALTHAGYLNAKATSGRTVDDAKKTVDVTVTVDAGQQYQMGRLEFQGLDLNGEAELKKMWTLKEGGPFNPDYPDYFLKRVREDGVFDNLGATKAESHRNEKNHTVDVTLTFKGADPAQVIKGRRGGRGGPQ